MHAGRAAFTFLSLGWEANGGVENGAGKKEAEIKAMSMSGVRTKLPALARTGLLALVAVGLVLVGVAGASGPLNLEDWFPPEIVTVQLPIGEPVGLTAGDFNGDGLPDLFLITEVNRPDVFWGVPNPDYELRFYLLPGEEEGWGEPILVGTLPLPGFYLWLSDVCSGVDLDGDGNEDLVALLTFSPVPEPSAVLDPKTFQTDLFLFWGHGDGTFTVERMRDLPVGLLPPASIVAGDFNADGLVDLAYDDPQNLAIHLLYNRGGRRFSSPHIVVVGQEEDECIPLPGQLRVARLDEAREGDDIVVGGPCIFSQDDYAQFIRGLISCGESCWELSPLVLTGPRKSEFRDVLGDFMVGDFNGDGYADVVFTQRLFFEQHEGEPLLPTAMGIYLMTGDGRGGFGPPVFLHGMAQGSLLSVERAPDGGWEVIALSYEINGAVVLRIKGNGISSSTTSIPVRGHAADGVVLDRAGGREIVVASSLDLESEVTLLNVVRRRSS